MIRYLTLAAYQITKDTSHIAPLAGGGPMGGKAMLLVWVVPGWSPVGKGPSTREWCSTFLVCLLSGALVTLF